MIYLFGESTVGICDCRLADGSYCKNITIWNDMCRDCFHAYEDEIDYPGIKSGRFWDETTGPKVGLDVVQKEIDDSVTFKIKTTDKDFARQLIHFLDECKVKEGSTKVKIK